MVDPHGGPREGADVLRGPSREHGHPGAKEYVVIAVILAIVTSIEVAVYYIDAMRPVLPPILIVASAVKFSLVVMFFMHLKFDSKLFTSLFVGGMLLAAVVLFGLLTKPLSGL
jgi:cytochrome c oxidase subunit IV